MGVAGEGIETRERIELVTEKLETDRFFIGGGGVNFDHVATHAKLAAREIHIVALIQHVDQAAEDGFAADVLAALHREQHVHVIFRRRDAIDA